MTTKTPSRDESTGTDDAAYSYHTEPFEQGRARYVRCETCGAECVPANPDRMLHRTDCPHAEAR